MRPLFSIVIPHRNEDQLAATCEAVRRACNDVPHEIITINDGGQRSGPGYDPPDFVDVKHGWRHAVGNCVARHWGIMNARAEAVLVIDAHMAFPHNFSGAEWYIGGFLTDSAARNPDRFACFACPTLRPPGTDDGNGGVWATLDEQMRGIPEPTYYGAYLKWRDERTDCDGVTWRRVLPNKWNGPIERDLCRSHGSADVGCILGGAYLFCRSRYIEIGAPWQYPRFWGHSEQFVSLANWLCGGRNVVLSLPIGHMFRTGLHAPYSGEMFKLYVNQMALIDVFVDDPDDRAELTAHLAADFRDRAAVGRKAERMLATLNLDAWRDVLDAKRSRSWAEYKAKYIRGDI